MSRPDKHNILFPVTYEDLYSVKSAVADLQETLEKINLAYVLHLISIINNNHCIHFADSPESRSVQIDLIRQLFPRDIVDTIVDRVSGKRDIAIVFHREQQLYLMHRALIYCPTQGGTMGDSARWDYAMACLMANDHWEPQRDVPVPPVEETYEDELLLWAVSTTL